MKRQASRKWWPLAVLLFVVGGAFWTPRVAGAGTVRYAAPTARGTGDCSSWANACTLQQALAQAQSGDEIWVQEGTYTPGGSRSDTFRLKSGVAVYGGFAGTETRRDQRDWQAHPTILSGDIGTVGDNSDNVYHVVIGANNAILDGFTVTGGNANSSRIPDSYGGGMYNENSSPTLTNVIFRQNSADFGGGMYNTADSNPSLTNVTFDSNLADLGGGMYNTNRSSPTLSNVTFSHNTATRHGGGMHNAGVGVSPSLSNVTFRNNSAGSAGGGMGNFSASPTLRNVTFSHNSAFYGGGMCNLYSSTTPVLINVTFSQNSASRSGLGGGIYNGDDPRPTLINVLITGSSTQGGDCVSRNNAPLNPNSRNNLIEDSTYACGLADGTNGNIVGRSANVGALGNYGGSTETVPLNAGSPAIDAGDAASCPATDQRGVPRPQGNGCDIGAYERDAAAPTVAEVQGAVAAGGLPLAEGAVVHQGFAQMSVRFSEQVYNPTGDAEANDVTNPENYLLVRDNGDGIQTTSCAAGVAGGDLAVPVDTVTYTDNGGNGPYEATLALNGGVPLPYGQYRLLVCGTTSIMDLAQNRLAGDGQNAGTDFVRNFTIAPAETLPATGFAPGRVTVLPQPPRDLAYQGLTLRLEVPRLGLEADIVGVPPTAGGWDVTWLGDAIGWLQGTAFPTWEGNAVLTGHVTGADGQPGPLARLHLLGYDDAVVVHLGGQAYEFRVREVRLVRPGDTGYVLEHLEGYPYLTLVTCRGYDEGQGAYRWRWVVRAVLVAVHPDGP